jgi:hypothetical protein
MLHEKVFEVTVNVHNPINFCADKSRHLMAELRKTYAGRCYKGCFIVQIVSVLHPSACHISRTNCTGEGYVDVRFIAHIRAFCQWDILVGVEIVSHQQIVVGTYDSPDGGDNRARAVVTALASKSVETLAVGQIISVRVYRAMHQPMQTQASVVGTLLTCDQSAPVYRLLGALSPSAAIELEPMLRAIDAELNARAEIIKTRKADLWFFELLLCSHRSNRAASENEQTLATWNGVPDWVGPGQLVASEPNTTKNVLDIVRRVVNESETVKVDGYWSRPLNLYRSSPLAASVDTPPPNWPDAIEGTPRQVFATYLKNILDFLVATRELTIVYGTKALIEAHVNVWGVMRAAQIPVD